MLIDAGLSYRELTRRLGVLHVDPDSLSAILVTHLHIDHVRCAGAMSRRHDVPVYATAATREAWGARASDVSEWRCVTPGRPAPLGSLQFLPFVVPHDAGETLAFRIDTPDGRIGFATDVGYVTPELATQFRECCLLVIESNHAVDLLRVSPYARSVRARIGGNDGHLSNEALAAFVVEHLGEAVRCVVLAHLSRVNNVPEIAEMTCHEALLRRGRTDVQVIVATQVRPTSTIDLASLAPPLAAMASVPVVRQQRTLPFGEPDLRQPSVSSYDRDALR